MADWADVKDMYEVDIPAPELPQEQEYSQQPQRIHDPRSLRVELPGLPWFMKHRGILRALCRKKPYREAVQYAFAQRMDRLPQGFTQIHGGKSTAELRLTVCVTPPRSLPRRWKDSMYQSMLTGFIKPSTQTDLDYVIRVITWALCGKPLCLVRRRANIARISAEVAYAEREGVIIELRKDRQFYNIHMR